MPRVVPSQVVDFINTVFPAAKTEVEGQPIQLGTDYSHLLSSILDLAQQVSPELLVMPTQQYAEYIASISTIRWWIERWQRQAKHSPPQVILIHGLRKHSPVALIRQALAICPDEFPSTDTSSLEFIADPAFKENLRLDISATNSALGNGEWKAATVLAGSVIEALLLWALQQQQQTIVMAAPTAVKLKLSSNLEKWYLPHYVEVAAELKLIVANTAIECRLAKDFRNLIHPGRTLRFAQVCNRGTALSAVAAVEHVITDLSSIN